MNQLIKELPVYLVVAISSLFIMCFFVHAMVGGLVSQETEYMLYVVICAIDLIVMGFMARDVIKRRKNSAGSGTNS
ncbi:MAG TPA: hypothetical protein VIU46_01475 [Gallionellaceae bacterium]